MPGISLVAEVDQQLTHLRRQAEAISRIASEWFELNSERDFCAKDLATINNLNRSLNKVGNYIYERLSNL